MVRRENTNRNKAEPGWKTTIYTGPLPSGLPDLSFVGSWRDFMYSQATSLVQSPPWISSTSRFRAKFFSRACKTRLWPTCPRTRARTHTNTHTHTSLAWSLAPPCVRSLVLTLKGSLCGSGELCAQIRVSPKLHPSCTPAATVANKSVCLLCEQASHVSTSLSLLESPSGPQGSRYI